MNLIAGTLANSRCTAVLQANRVESISRLTIDPTNSNGLRSVSQIMVGCYFTGTAMRISASSMGSTVRSLAATPW